jgi:hypothetical protein
VPLQANDTSKKISCGTTQRGVNDVFYYSRIKKVRAREKMSN